MDVEKQASARNRRQFLQSVVPAGCIACLLQQPVIHDGELEETGDTVPMGDPDTDSHWTYRRIYRFAYRQWMIPQLTNLAESVGGREALIEMLKQSSLTLGRRSAEAAGVATFEDFASWLERAFETSEIYQNTLTWEPFRHMESGLEYRVTSCLWAETFRAADAGDLGYAAMCYQDVGLADGLGEILRMERASTLMEGGEACAFRFLRT